MRDPNERAPVSGEVWVHTKSRHRYRIAGRPYNAITDQIEVLYEPLYACEFKSFTRQLADHPKAFLSLNDDGEPRFQRET